VTPVLPWASMPQSDQPDYGHRGSDSRKMSLEKINSNRGAFQTTQDAWVSLLGFSNGLVAR